ncbi:hypothetical protein NOVA_29360 [Nocardia nova]|uniref:hypothetical protein n=1 Tax=Nocardia nova TaxID=37330 RepID=UPI001C46B590|nr:hypothetical protein [Nocardia nova]MBV7706899.1 hypothetical protein [Nocardia nova]
MRLTTRSAVTTLLAAAVAIPVGIAAGTQKFNQLQARRAQAAATLPGRRTGS